MVIREGIGMSPLSVKLLLGKFLSLLCILSTFTFILLPFLTFVRRAYHDGQFFEEPLVQELSLYRVVMASFEVRAQGRGLDVEAEHFYLQSTAYSEISVHIGSLIPAAPPNFTPVVH
jgi:hypothetical protein